MYSYCTSTTNKYNVIAISTLNVVCLKLHNADLVLSHDELVEEKVVAVGVHLAEHGMISTNPDVDLLALGRVEVPAAVLVLELVKQLGITVLLTDSVGVLVLASK